MGVGGDAGVDADGRTGDGDAIDLDADDNAARLARRHSEKGAAVDASAAAPAGPLMSGTAKAWRRVDASRRAQEQAQAWQQAAFRRAQNTVRSVRRKVSQSGMVPTMGVLEGRLRKVFPHHKREYTVLDYRMPTPLQVADLELACKTALAMHWQGNHAQARCMISEVQLEAIKSHGFRLPAYTAPYRDKQTYSSYGRNFTKQQVLLAIVLKLSPFVRDGDMLIDHSCGTNEWLQVAESELAQQGFKDMSYCGFDIFLAKNDRNFQCVDFMQMTRRTHPWLRLPSGDRLIVGLNPPFGFDVHGGGQNLAYKFALHAAKMLQARILVLICPQETAHPDGYDLLDEDKTLCEGLAFYFPGSKDKTKPEERGPDGCLLDQQTRILSVVRIYLRRAQPQLPPGDARLRGLDHQGTCWGTWHGAARSGANADGGSALYR